MWAWILSSAASLNPSSAWGWRQRCLPLAHEPDASSSFPVEAARHIVVFLHIGSFLRPTGSPFSFSWLRFFINLLLCLYGCIYQYNVIKVLPVSGKCLFSYAPSTSFQAWTVIGSISPPYPNSYLTHINNKNLTPIHIKQIYVLISVIVSNSSLIFPKDKNVFIIIE